MGVSPIPRDQNGNYTLPAGNPVVPGTAITTLWANPTMQDLANEITNSLSRDGEGGMLVPFKNIDGTVGTPGITWTNESVTGFYRAEANDMRTTVGGIDKMRWTSSGVQVWNTVDLIWEDVATGGDTGDYLPLVGGIVTGQIKGVTPVAPEDLVRKDYVDAIEPGLQSFNTREAPDVVPQLGDYPASIVDYDAGSTPFWDATEVQTALEEAYADIQFLAGSITLKGIWDSDANDPDLLTIPKINGNYWIVSVEGSTVLPPYLTAVITLPWLINDRALYIDDGVDSGFAQIRQGTGDYLPLLGGTMLGQINGVAPAPTLAAHLTRKDYVDTQIANIPPPDLTDYLPLTGGTVTGQIKGITPVDDADLTRKDYVLEQIALGGGDGLVSFKGRTAPDVVPIYNDYQADLVSFDNAFAPNWGTNVQEALVDAYDTIQFLVGEIVLKGVWDSLSNLPDLITLPDKENGNYWIVTVEGSTVLPLFPGAPAFDLPYLVNDRVMYFDNGIDTGFAQIRPGTSAYLQLTGGTMIGQIKGITPVDAPDLTRKDYVDSEISSGLSGYLPLTGGTLTGDLFIDTPDSSDGLLIVQSNGVNTGYCGKIFSAPLDMRLYSYSGNVQIDANIGTTSINAGINIDLNADAAVNITAPTTNIDGQTDITGKLFVKADGNAITARAISSDQPVRIDFLRQDGASYGYVGKGDNTDFEADLLLACNSGNVTLIGQEAVNLNAPTVNAKGLLYVTTSGGTVSSSLFFHGDSNFERARIWADDSNILNFRATSTGGVVRIHSTGDLDLVGDVTAFRGTANEISMSDLVPSKAGTVSSTGIGNYNVVFTTPFPDANYAITLSEGTTLGIGFDPNTTYSNKAATGFSVSTNTSTVPLNIDWIATPYKS